MGVAELLIIYGNIAGTLRFGLSRQKVLGSNPRESTCCLGDVNLLLNLPESVSSLKQWYLIGLYRELKPMLRSANAW